MKRLVALSLVVLLTGCASVKNWIPSFSDPNQSARIIDVRQSVAQLDCKQTHAPQVKKIKDNLDWFQLYSDSKGWRQNDVLRLVKPMQETVDDFYKRSNEKQGSETYCEIKKKVMTTQAEKAASAILGRF
jgi:flagellar basal body L-ring protein FlgH